MTVLLTPALLHFLFSFNEVRNTPYSYNYNNLQDIHDPGIYMKIIQAMFVNKAL